jgi:hypothetical protein
MKNFLVAFASLVVFVLPVRAQTASVSQDAAPDLNTYYRFPFSMGVEYQSLSPFGAFATDFTSFQVNGTVHVPLPFLPQLQPIAQISYLEFDDHVDGRWSHQDYGGSLGISYDQRFSKNFEVGAELLAGAAEAVYPQLDPSGPMGSPTLLFQAGARLSLDPSYGMSIDVHPSLQYLMSLSPLTDFDGFILGVGFSVHYRFGDDPDAPQAVIRSIRFEKAEVPPAFTSMQGFYSRNPIGKVTITNTEKQALTDVEVSFYQKGYMDAPTPSLALGRLDAGARLEVPLKAVFNSEVYKLTGGFKPLTGEVIVSYKRGGRAAEQRTQVTYDLYDKTAMTWDDDRKASAFITTLDSALQNYEAFLSETGKPKVLAGYSKPIQDAMLTYDGLREIGMFYQEDPTAPFTRVQSDPTFVDFISMPRLTLKRRYGDCKNLTVLFCSLLETRGIKTGFITVPGHIYPVIDTGVPSTDYRELNPDRTMTLALGDTLWIPVEVTMLDGKSDFQAAWRRGIEEWKQYEKERKFYRTSDAQAIYSPVAVEDQDLGLQYGKSDEIAQFFQRDLEAQGGAVLAGYSAAADASHDRKDYNRLGTTAARLGRFSDASDAFEKALKVDPKYTAAMVNLANVSFLKGDYSRAVDSYKAVLALLGSPARGSPAEGVEVVAIVNLARAYSALHNSVQSDSYMAQAAALDAEKVKSMGETPMGASGTRAANSAEAAGGVGFVEDSQ